MAFQYQQIAVNTVKQALAGAVYRARFAVSLNGATTWHFAQSISKVLGNNYLQVDVPLDHTVIGAGTVTDVWLYDASDNVLVKISTSISRPTATDDVYFRAIMRINT